MPLAPRALSFLLSQTPDATNANVLQVPLVKRGCWVEGVWEVWERETECQGVREGVREGEGEVKRPLGAH